MGPANELALQLVDTISSSTAAVAFAGITAFKIKGFLTWVVLPAYL
jgi:hypothetical protein